jgi:hypothetical protein
MGDCLAGFQHHENDVYWNTTHTRESPSVWGAQVYLISRRCARKFVDMFHSRRLSELAFAMESSAGTCPVYSRRVPQLIIDSLMPIFLNQGFVYPLMGVERQFAHSISADANIDGIWKTYMKQVEGPYYSFPPPAP